MAQNVGTLEAYQEGEDFESYAERFEQFLVANAITDAGRKKAIFLTVCGPTVYQLLRNMCAPAKPSEKTLEVLLDLAKKHYAPKVSVVVARYRFNSERQKAGQSVSSYVATLKKKASCCNFGENLTEQLRDRFVCGVHDERTQRRLLQEGDDLTWDKAVKLATSMETAAVEVRLLSGESERQVNKIEQSTHKPGPSRRTLSAAREADK